MGVAVKMRQWQNVTGLCLREAQATEAGMVTRDAGREADASAKEAVLGGGRMVDGEAAKSGTAGHAAEIR
jgi:hypothetical protein